MTILAPFQRRRFRRKIRRAKSALAWVDTRMVALGCPAWKRQQMRRDIVTSDRAWLDYLAVLDEPRVKKTVHRVPAAGLGGQK